MYYQTAKEVHGTQKNVKNHCVYIKNKYLCHFIYKIRKRTYFTVLAFAEHLSSAYKDILFQEEK